jgi:putative GTP pyrophosphokinase
MPYAQAVDELCGKFKSLDKEYRFKTLHSPIEHVQGRVKRVGSILEKARRKRVPVNKIVEGIRDIAGIRIICQFVEDIGAVVQIVRRHEGFDLRVLDEQDYITNAKPSGYRCYHIHVEYPIFTMDGMKKIPVEIQIRTMSMDFWATIEHSLKYKYNGKIPEALRGRLIHTAEAAFQLDKEMSTIRDEIIETQKVIRVKNDLADQILKKIQDLHSMVKTESINELNKEFYGIYNENDVAKLNAFNYKLDTMMRLYSTESFE